MEAHSQTGKAAGAGERHELKKKKWSDGEKQPQEVGVTGQTGQKEEQTEAWPRGRDVVGGAGRVIGP